MGREEEDNDWQVPKVRRSCLDDEGNNQPTEAPHKSAAQTAA